LAEKAARYDRAAAKDRLKADVLQSVAEHVSQLGMWTRVPPTGRKPKLSRDDLAQAAVTILDDEGLDALSMRRLATELDVGTMTLYHYVETKDEVLALALDTVMGETLVPPDQPFPTEWRDAMVMTAMRSRDCLQRHPWMLDLHADTPYGPSTIRHFDQTIQAVNGLDAPLYVKLDIALAVDEYTFGYCLSQRARLVKTDEDSAILDYVRVLIETGEYPSIAQLDADVGLEQLWVTLEEIEANGDRFEQNLRRLLDGFVPET
jgi:AcrR family transcriptional regulator